MNRVCAAYVSKSHVERVFLSVGPEELIAEPVRPRRQERNAAQLWILLIFGYVSVREVEDVLAVDVELVRGVSHRRHDRDLDVVGRVGQPNYRYAVVGGALSFIVLSNRRQ